MYSLRAVKRTTPYTEGRRYWSSEEQDIFDLGVAKGIRTAADMSAWMTENGYPKTPVQVNTYRQKRVQAEAKKPRKRSNGELRPLLPDNFKYRVFGPQKWGEAGICTCTVCQLHYSPKQEYEPVIDTTLGFESLLPTQEELPTQNSFVVPEISKFGQ